MSSTKGYSPVFGQFTLHNADPHEDFTSGGMRFPLSGRSIET